MIKNWKMFNESNWSPEDILIELSLELKDEGLYVELPNDNKFGGKFYVAISDYDKVFCKNYPQDDMDWLYDKPIMLNFYKELEEFGLIRDKDYKIYGGGAGINLVFDDKRVVKL